MPEPIDCGSILLVEDEFRLRQTLARSLARRDFQVVEATTAAEAIAVDSGERFDLMLLDINLPDATGWDVLCRLRDIERQPPVVVMSAVPPNPARVREFTPFGILHKPFPIDALLRLIRAACATSDPTGRSALDLAWHDAEAYVRADLVLPLKKDWSWNSSSARSPYLLSSSR